MARVKVPSKATQQFARRLTKARLDAGLSREKAARALERTAQVITSDETIRRFEGATVDVEVVDLPIVVGLAQVYGVKVGTLSPVIQERVKSLRDLLVRMSACITAASAPATAA